MQPSPAHAPLPSRHHRREALVKERAFASTDSELLVQTQRYLVHRQQGLPNGPDLEAAWSMFYEHFTHKIRAYSFTCGASDEDIVDCVQDVWRELLVRLPTFMPDAQRGKFDSWLFSIIQGKAADICRCRKRRSLQGTADCLPTVPDHHPVPGRRAEEDEMVALVWSQLRKRLSQCSFKVLRLRLVEQLPVAQVAEKLGLSEEQVWYRYHRARRKMQEIGACLAAGRPLRLSAEEAFPKKKEFAQDNTACPVSRHVGTSSPTHQGGHRVDYVFQKLELGRRELNPEWKVEWNCVPVPRAVLYIRKSAIVAYAELCGPADFVSAHWPRIVNAAIAAGMAAGIATIINTPTAALPIFQAEFYKHLHAKGGAAPDDRLQVALSARQEANGPWCECKG